MEFDEEERKQRRKMLPVHRSVKSYLKTAVVSYPHKGAPQTSYGPKMLTGQLEQKHVIQRKPHAVVLKPIEFLDK
jgi:hypothetical protein